MSDQTERSDKNGDTDNALIASEFTARAETRRLTIEAAAAVELATERGRHVPFLAQACQEVVIRYRRSCADADKVFHLGEEESLVDWIAPAIPPLFDLNKKPIAPLWHRSARERDTDTDEPVSKEALETLLQKIADPQVREELAAALLRIPADDTHLRRNNDHCS